MHVSADSLAFANGIFAAAAPSSLEPPFKPTGTHSTNLIQRERERVHHCSDPKGISIVIHGREAPVVNFVVGYSEAFIRLVGVRIGTVVTIHPYA